MCIKFKGRTFSKLLLKVVALFIRSECDERNSSNTHARLAKEAKRQRRLIGSKLLRYIFD
ncbi:MAG: hypothetical protein GX236_11075 [Clostridiaceae bacterium]|nr:hypothetical protein [Clostridiaceae bacterium]